MPRKQQITDAELRAMMDKNWSQAAIVRRTGLNASSISRRIAKLKAGVVGSTDPPRDAKSLPSFAGKPNATFDEKMKLLEAAGIAVEFEDDDEDERRPAADIDAVDDPRKSAAWAVRRARQLVNDASDPKDVSRALAGLQRAIDFQIRVHEREVAVEEIRAFFEEVLAELDDCEPGTKARVVERLEERRTLRRTS